MEIVDMVFAEIWFSGPKSRSANIFPAVGFGTSMGFHPPGQPSLLSTPWKPYDETHFI